MKNSHFSVADAETLRKCLVCLGAFWELVSYIEERSVAGRYVPICMECDPESLLPMPSLTYEGWNAKNTQ